MSVRVRQATARQWTERSVKQRYGLKPTEYITVCDSCLQASCWLGEFYCDSYKTAGTVKRTVRDLIKLNREHPHYWTKEGSKTAEEKDNV